MRLPVPLAAILATVVMAASLAFLAGPRAAAPAGPAQAAQAPGAAQPVAEDAALLDAPLLFVKRHPYMAPHIYDSYYMWHPGGGVHVIENPADPPAKHRVRAIIDPNTPETLGVGVYRDPDISWDGKRILFAFKGSPDGDTSIYEIGADGRGLRRLTDPGKACTLPPPPGYFGAGRHDVNPCYLPDGRIVFTSTRQAGRVPCFNSEVDTLHVMNADGGDVHPISVNNVTDFDPSVLPDGRILYGRWEYVDKTALYIQSLWTIFPDGTNETALFANNLARPTALLQARAVPDTHLVACSLTPHNGQAVGAIAVIDPQVGKNDLKAIANFTPEYPTEMDQGLARGPSDPWPLTADVILISNNAKGHGVIELVRRDGRRTLVHAEPDISCYAPMLLKPRPRPPAIAPAARQGTTGRFLVQDIYRGLTGVARGEVRQLRVIEETARVSGIPPGGRWWNQAFLVSWQGGYVVKNILGVVPVEADGSALFEAPAGRALYFQAMDERGRVLQSMRTFIQAAPGVTRSCIGCHEDKMTSPAPESAILARSRSAAIPKAEPWGSGFLDYPAMVQPVMDEHCVSCHGGKDGIAGALDLTGGWTWAFNLSYESLIKNTLTGFLNCENGSVHTSRILPPRTHGSAAAALTDVLLGEHEGRIPEMTDAQKRLLLAWMDTNSSYHGTWDWTPQATCEAILEASGELAGAMRRAGCTRCHAAQVGDDWINLRDPELSRILRAPLAEAKDDKGFGLAWCRGRKARPAAPPVTQSRQPPDIHRPARVGQRDPNGTPVVTFASTEDAGYQAMLAVIRRARAAALAKPRVDMPTATAIPGQIRMLVPQPPPQTAPALSASLDGDGTPRLRWARSAETIGMAFELHRSQSAGFAPAESTRIAATPGFAAADANCPPGDWHYALAAISGDQRSGSSRASLTVPAPPPPPAVGGLAARGEPGLVALAWEQAEGRHLRYHVYRAPADGESFTRLTAEPIAACAYEDAAEGAAPMAYRLCAVDHRGTEGPPSAAVTAAPLPQPRQPLFTAFGAGGAGVLADGTKPRMRLIGGAKLAADAAALDLSAGGHATFGHERPFDIAARLTVECRLRIDRMAQMPVILACGAFDDRGWFIQAFGGRWRWHLGGVSCDGGQAVAGKWVHLLCTYDGRHARVFQDGRQVAEAQCNPNVEPWPGPLVVGQYSAAGPQYQVFGAIRDVKLYRRALAAAEAAAASKAGP